MKKTLLTLGTMAGSLVAGPVDFEIIPEGAQWYLHADVEAVRDTEMGGNLQEMIEEEAGKELKAVTRIFAFDPMEDLNSLTVFGEGENAVLLIGGEFDREHMEDVIGAADEHESRDYEGVTVHSWDDKGKTQHGAFVADDLVAISDQPKHLRHALDVMAGRRNGMEAVKAEGSPLIFGLANLSKMEIEDEDLEIFKQAESLTVRLDEKGEEMDAKMEIATEDPKLAKRMRRMVDGIFAMVETSIPDIDDYDVESEVTLGNDKTTIVANVTMPSKRMIDFLEYLDTLEED